MQNFARLAKAGSRAAVPVAAGVVATANQPVAQADAHHAGDVLSPRRRIQDGWELAEFEGRDVVLFKPDEIDDALAYLTGKPQHPTASAVIDELDSDVSSDGTVDAVLEHGYSTGIAASYSVGGLDMQDLCTLAGRLLKSPGVQREILTAAVTDPEVFDILASKMDLPEYLEGAGFAARGLIAGPAETAADAASSSGSSPVVDQLTAPNTNPLLQLSAKVGEGVEQVGNAVVRLGRWMRSQLPGGSGAEASARSEHAGKSPNKAATVMGAVMMICVAVVTVILLKRPSALKSILQSFRGRVV